MAQTPSQAAYYQDPLNKKIRTYSTRMHQHLRKGNLDKAEHFRKMLNEAKAAQLEEKARQMLEEARKLREEEVVF